MLSIDVGKRLWWWLQIRVMAVMRACGHIFGFSADHGVGLFWKWSEVGGGSQIKSQEINRRPFAIRSDFRRNRYGEKKYCAAQWFDPIVTAAKNRFWRVVQFGWIFHSILTDIWLTISWNFSLLTSLLFGLEQVKVEVC